MKKGSCREVMVVCINQLTKSLYGAVPQSLMMVNRMVSSLVNGRQS
jgi:hypothetical protein